MYVFVCVSVCMCVCVYVHTCARVCVCVHMHTCMCVYVSCGLGKDRYLCFKSTAPTPVPASLPAPKTIQDH